MLLLMTDLLDRTAVGLQRGLCGEETLQRFIGDGQNFGNGIGRGTVNGDQQGHGFVAHILIETVAGVFIALAGGIVEQQTQAIAAFIILFKIVQ